MKAHDKYKEFIASNGPYKINHYHQTAIAMARDILSKSPFVEQGPHIRALLISWLMTGLINRHEMNRQYESDQSSILRDFRLLHKEIIFPQDIDYSIVDLHRLRRSFEIFFSNFSEATSLAIVNGYYSDIDLLIQKKGVIEYDLGSAHTRVASFVTKDGHLKRPCLLREWGERVSGTFLAPKVDNLQKAKDMAILIKELSIVGRVHWPEVVFVMKTFRQQAITSRFTQAEWARVQQAFTKLTRDWEENPDAMAAAQAEIKAKITLEELPH